MRGVGRDDQCLLIFYLFIYYEVASTGSWYNIVNLQEGVRARIVIPFTSVLVMGQVNVMCV